MGHRWAPHLEGTDRKDTQAWLQFRSLRQARNWGARVIR